MISETNPRLPYFGNIKVAITTVPAGTFNWDFAAAFCPSCFDPRAVSERESYHGLTFLLSSMESFPLIVQAIAAIRAIYHQKVRPRHEASYLVRNGGAKPP